MFLKCGEDEPVTRKITAEASNLLQNLKEGESVMVDWGFTIAQNLPKDVSLLIPHFENRVTGQFTKDQLEYSEKLAVARIHVERAMKAITDFRILEHKVRLSMIKNFENVFKVCAYLVNFKKTFFKN